MKRISRAAQSRKAAGKAGDMPCEANSGLKPSLRNAAVRRQGSLTESALIICIIIFAAVAIRLIWLFLCPYAFMDGDTATMGFTALRILYGHFPIFFYGQCYLAPAESYLIALSFIMFGVNSISLQIVPLVIMLCTGWVIYLLGKELKNREVGFWAMVYFIFPPLQLFFRSFKSQGYIPELMFLGSLILLFSLKIIGKASDSQKRFYYFIIGLVSGIGFWITGLMIYFIITAGIFLVVNFKKAKIIRYGIIWVLTFFIIGLPYWIFSIRHHFSSFDFGISHNVHIGLIFHKFFTLDLRNLVSAGLGDTVDAFVLAAYGIILLVFIYYTITKRGRNIWLLWIFAGTVLFFYTRPNFYRLAIIAKTRYVFCLYVFIALMTGYTAYLLNKKARFTGSIFVSALICLHIFSVFNNMPDSKKHSSIIKAKYERMAGFLSKRHINKIMVSNRRLRELMFLGGERFICRQYDREGYASYDNLVSNAEHAAFYLPQADSALNAVCRGFSKGGGFYYNFQRYPYRYKEISPAKWHIQVNLDEEDSMYAIDRNYSTSWSSVIPKKKGMYFQADLGSLYKIAKLQFFYNLSYHNLLGNYRILISLDGKKWKEVLEANNIQPFFWSGPRLYWYLYKGRCELIFTPALARYIRIVQNGDNAAYPWEIKELFIYEYAGEDVKAWDKDNLYNAYKFLSKQGVDFIYADFWASSRIRQWSRGSIKTLRPFEEFSFMSKPNSWVVNWAETSGFVLEEDNKEGWDRLINEFRIPLARKRFGRYWCYYFGNLTVKEKVFFKGLKSIYWIGITGIKVDLFKYAAICFKRGIICERNDRDKDAVYWYKQALNNFPEYEAYMRLKALGEDVSLWKGYFIPEHPKEIRFANGVTFLGITIDEKDAACGYIDEIDFFWKFKKKPHKNIVLFLHFMKGEKIIFQGDHFFPCRTVENVGIQPKDIFREHYLLKIPGDIKPGAYDIIAGLWIPKEGKRIRIIGAKKTAVNIGTLILRRKINRRVQGVFIKNK